MTDFPVILKERANAVELALDKFVSEKENPQKKIYGAMRYSLLGGGKRMRGILALTGGLLAGGTKEDVMPFACAMEMIHAYSLIHDDLPAMDNDDMRRGKPSCHRQFDEATAILAGDALLNGAFELMLTASVKPENKLKAMEIIANGSGTEGMIGGQVVDIANEGSDMDCDTLTYLHSLKTGALIKASLLGGYFACGGNEHTEKLTLYAEKLGLAFQVVDDILDVIGDEKLLGKKVNSDKNNGKKTFVDFKGLEGSKEYAQALSREATAAVSSLGVEGEFLSLLADYLLDRRF